MNDIVAAEAIPVSIPFTHADGRTGVSATGGTWTTLDVLLVRLETREGLVGWGECFGYSLRALPRTVLETRLFPQVIGRSCDELLGQRQQLARSVHAYGRGGAVQFALSGLDIALWDLAGKQADKPLHELLGGREPRFTAYASLFRYDDPILCSETARRARDSGFGTIKLHETTIDAIAAVRNACGNDVAIATDVNCVWTHDEAIERICAFADLDLAWVEEPIWPPDDHPQLASVKRSVPLALAAGENEPNATLLLRLAAAEAVDILQPSVTKLGGISEMVHFLRQMDPNAGRIVPHSFYIGPGLLATMHALSLGPDDVMIEWMFADPAAHLFTDAITPENGIIEAPDGPGLGQDPDPDVIARFRCS